MESDLLNNFLSSKKFPC